jgi:hypothetical protein
MTWGTSVDADMLSVSISSSRFAATSVRFEVFFAFFDCFTFFVILFPPRNPQKYMRVERSTAQV